MSVATATLADLYERQGHVAEALAMYRQLLAGDPDDPRLQRRVRELEASLIEGGGDERRRRRVERLRALLHHVHARRRA